jgi:hypothetical protein
VAPKVGLAPISWVFSSLLIVVSVLFCQGFVSPKKF